jgi:tripartite-type tricarboxylate transporter receptor subunit TctC
MNGYRPTARSIALALVFLLAGAAAATAQPAAEFYKGKTVTIVIGSDVGGGYDAYGRLVARHLGAHIPGNPSVVPNNMAGAAQTKAANYVYSLAAKDGTYIAALSPGALLTAVLGGPPIQYDPNKFQYVGSAKSDVYVCIARPDAPAKKFADIFDHEMIVGVSSGSSTLMMPLLLKNLLGAKFKIVRGYPGTRQMQLAIERNEIQGICGLGYASLRVEHEDWLTQGTVTVLAQESSRGTPELDKMGVPLATAFAKTDEQRAVMDLVYSQEIFGRPFVMAPEVPKERVAVIRDAFLAALRDPALLEEAAKSKLDVEALSGAEVQQLVAKVYATPPAIVKRTHEVLEIAGQN